jgi:hypothetical protein
MYIWVRKLPAQLDVDDIQLQISQAELGCVQKVTQLTQHSVVGKSASFGASMILSNSTLRLTNASMVNAVTHKGTKKMTSERIKVLPESHLLSVVFFLFLLIAVFFCHNFKGPKVRQ